MGAVVSLEGLIDQRRVWRGRQEPGPSGVQPTGHAALDAVLPSGGWPPAALSEILLAANGSGELQLLWPTLARLSQAGERIVLIAPPFIPYPHAWMAAGVRLQHLSVLQAQGKDALWAAEQCLRSGSCAAVLCWPQNPDDKALRRLQVAAETGETLGFALRERQAAQNPSPAALRLALQGPAGQVQVLKCRGGIPPAMPVTFASYA
ncbi:translesion DNA synthesis-associated protein ImuA [Pseudomonas putida]|jgi:hypothetical protein|nr:translesion DNA synthesis-associated protein ImuA [Pseudomonas putida]